MRGGCDNHKKLCLLSAAVGHVSVYDGCRIAQFANIRPYSMELPPTVSTFRFMMLRQDRRTVDSLRRSFEIRKVR
jgi:hypothetical protein